MSCCPTNTNKPFHLDSQFRHKLKMLRQKHPRLKLDWAAYEKLHRQVLERDGWRCQNCGRQESLQVHHIRSRSQLGDDSELNLITLCESCHSSQHLGLARSIPARLEIE